VVGQAAGPDPAEASALGAATPRPAASTTAQATIRGYLLILRMIHAPVRQVSMITALSGL
jgi:hypothetical protein